MSTPGATRFFEQVRQWRSQDVERAVRDRPALVSLRDGTGRTALHACARTPLTANGRASDSIATARVLLAAGADIDAVQPIRDSGEIFPATALWYALGWGGNRALGRFLLRRGADPNHCLFAMVFRDDLESAKLLQKHGAQVDEVFHAETPLIYAVRHRRARFVAWLLRVGADPRFSDDRGFTALHHAVRRRLPDSTLRSLVRHGANVAGVSRDGVSVGVLATCAQRRLLGIAGA